MEIQIDCTDRETILNCLEEVEVLQKELNELRYKISEHRSRETEVLNKLNNTKKLARELSNKLFMDDGDRSKYGDWNPAG